MEEKNDQGNQGGGTIISTPGDWGTTIDLGRDVSKMSPNQIDFEIAELTKKGSPYYQKEHPHSGRIRDRVERLYQKKYSAQSAGEQGLTEGDRQLLGVLRQAGRGDETSDDELKQMIEEAPTVDEMNEETAINRGVRDLNRQFGKQASAVIESAQSLLKDLKISDKGMAFLGESGLGNDPDFITLLGIVRAKIMEARSRTGQQESKPKNKKKPGVSPEEARIEDFVAGARQLLKEGE